jgi:hypothetical protein
MTNPSTTSAKSGDRYRQGEEPPPLLGSWRHLYLAVIAWLVFLILVFYLFARRFAP